MVDDLHIETYPYIVADLDQILILDDVAAPNDGVVADIDLRMGKREQKECEILYGAVSTHFENGSFGQSELRRAFDQQVRAISRQVAPGPPGRH